MAKNLPQLLLHVNFMLCMSLSACMHPSSHFLCSILQCSLQYDATGSVGWYAVALQIEDFASTTDTIPLSSIPVQFLVNVFTSSQPCSAQPVFVGSTVASGACIAVLSTYNDTIFVETGGAGVRLALHNIFLSFFFHCEICILSYIEVRLCVILCVSIFDHAVYLHINHSIIASILNT